MPSAQLTPHERFEWQAIIAAADQNNVLHHCQICDAEWVTSFDKQCRCGSCKIERIACWQFPDD